MNVGMWLKDSTNQWKRRLAMPMIADVHHAPTDGAVPIEDVELPQGEIRVLGPVMWHGVDLHVGGDSLAIVLQVG